MRVCFQRVTVTLQEGDVDCYRRYKIGVVNAPRGGLSEAPTTTSTPAPPTTAPKPAASAAERAEAALRAAITGGGLSAIEWALAAAPREVREGGVGAQAAAAAAAAGLAAERAAAEAKTAADRT